MERMFVVVEWVYVRTGVGMAVLRRIERLLPPA